MFNNVCNSIGLKTVCFLMMSPICFAVSIILDSIFVLFFFFLPLLDALTVFAVKSMMSRDSVPKYRSTNISKEAKT